MKHTPEDIAFFKSLHDTSLGDNLVSYIVRLQDSLCDIRNGSTISNDARIEACKILETELIDKIKCQSDSKKAKINEYV